MPQFSWRIHMQDVERRREEAKRWRRREERSMMEDIAKQDAEDLASLNMDDQVRRSEGVLDKREKELLRYIINHMAEKERQEMNPAELPRYSGYMQHFTKITKEDNMCDEVCIDEELQDLAKHYAQELKDLTEELERIEYALSSYMRMYLKTRDKRDAILDKAENLKDKLEKIAEEE